MRGRSVQLARHRHKRIAENNVVIAPALCLASVRFRQTFECGIGFTKILIDNLKILFVDLTQHSLKAHAITELYQVNVSCFNNSLLSQFFGW